YIKLAPKHYSEGKLKLDIYRITSIKHTAYNISKLENGCNFRELPKFKILSGDIALENHLKIAEVIATFVGKTTQNTLISIIRKLIGKAKYFSVIFDETTDIPNQNFTTGYSFMICCKDRAKNDRRDNRKNCNAYIFRKFSFTYE
ncbi:protein FAM200B-like, partial [Aphis craccivora]